MSGHSPFPELDFRSADIPGGTFVNALWHRDLMRLSDRGRASELVGDRWAEICSQYLDGLAGTARWFTGDCDNPDAYIVRQIARLDDVPAIARIASSHHLQNPDFLIVGDRDAMVVVQSADAKFSVETAKSKQVSAEVAANLIALGPVVTMHIPRLAPESEMIDGFFLCPDFSLTHHMMQRTRGPHGSVSVPHQQIELVPISAPDFMAGLQGRDLALWLADRDSFPVSAKQNLLAFLYYFRLSRACAGCWIDQTAPLLSQKELSIVDDAEVLATAVSLTEEADSAWAIVQKWDSLAEQTRRQRTAVDQATSLPMSSGELRTAVEAYAKRSGCVAPSPSKVRRMIGAWFRSRIHDDFGSLLPPVDDFPKLLEKLSLASKGLRPQLPAEIERSVQHLVDQENNVQSVNA